MFNISIIDSNYKNQIQMIDSCKSILQDISFVILSYNSLEEFKTKDVYYSAGHILIVNEVFLDEKSIMQLKEIQSLFKNLHIMFYGNNISSILDSYEVSHFYFVLQEEIEERLPIALKLGLKKIEQGYHPFFSFTFKNKYHIIYYNEVVHIRFVNRQIYFFTEDNTYTLYISKKRFLNNLDKKIFLAVSPNELINLDYVSYFEKPYFFMKNGEKIQASLSYLPVIDEIFEQKQLCLKNSFTK